MSAFEPAYSPDDLLPLSGIQHFCFCRRQWALIHVERQWAENRLTAEGRGMHERADDPFFIETRDGVITSRSLPVASYHLGLTGKCDVVEFSPSPEGVRLRGREGTYLPTPVEYKRGKPKTDRSDESQLCAQVMCLEEMLSVDIEAGYLYYGQTRHRVEVAMTDELRAFVTKVAAEMHDYFRRGHTPRVRISKACRSCSLNDICLPGLKRGPSSASAYIRKKIEDAS